MRLKIHSSTVQLWLSANDTYAWARNSNARWPCSHTANRRIYAEFDSNGLCDLSIDGGRGNQDVDGMEFSALCADHLRGKLEPDHPAYFVAVGQFTD